MSEIEIVLRRSEELEKAIFDIRDQGNFGQVELDLRTDAGIRLASVSLEHGAALRALIEAGLAPSAISLMRPQFEAMVRAAWAVWAANDTDIERLQSPLTLMTEKDASKLTGLSDMLKRLEGSPAPKGLPEMLNVFKGTSLMALNSFVHGGIHIMSRDVSGYPDQLLGQVLRNSNGLGTMAACCWRYSVPTKKLAAGWPRFSRRSPTAFPCYSLRNPRKPRSPCHLRESVHR